MQELGCAALAGLAGDPDAQEMLAAKGGPASVLNAMRRCAGGALVVFRVSSGCF